MNKSSREHILSQLRLLIQQRREEAGLSMNRLGEMSGLSQQTVSYIERGMRDPTVDSLLRICDALKVDASELLLEAEIKAEMIFAGKTQIDRL